MIEDNRADDRELFPKYIVKGWDDVVDSGGNEVPFSAEACREFFSQLPDWLFDDITEHAATLSNYLDEDDDEDAEDGEAVDGEEAGNA